MVSVLAYDIPVLRRMTLHMTCFGPINNNVCYSGVLGTTEVIQTNDVMIGAITLMLWPFL